MKKVLVIMMMCLVCNVSVEAKSKKEKERPMTEFEQWQKEEKLVYLLKRCEEFYSAAKENENERGLLKDSTLIAKRYKIASVYKKRYEELENSNYYVDFDHMKKTGYGYFYNGGYDYYISFGLDGKATSDLCTNKGAPFSLGKKVVQRINEETGYNERIAKDIEAKNEVSEFLKKH